jgi:predicted transposase YdaD
VEEIFHTLQNNPTLQTTAMSTAQALINQGLTKGRQEGRQEGQRGGVWMGKLQLLQEMMGLPVATSASLETLSEADLRLAFEQLQQEYNEKVKQR